MTAAISGKIFYTTKTDPYGEGLRKWIEGCVIVNPGLRCTIDECRKRLESLKVGSELSRNGTGV